VGTGGRLAAACTEGARGRAPTVVEGARARLLTQTGDDRGGGAMHAGRVHRTMKTEAWT
jgi:hypothetical protein